MRLLTILILLGIASSAMARDLPKITVEPTNESVQQALINTFTAAGLTDFIAIARCESQLTHYEDGSLLRNRQGSSARGILQLMSSLHPDATRIRQYNQRYGTAYTASDFDLHDPEQYLQYALLLAKVRGTQDWEASHSCWG